MAKRFFYRIFCGFFLGISVFAPGFSGSVIAITMGIYQDLVRIASNPFKTFKKNLIFCIPLGIGVVISAISFIIVFDFLFESYEKATYLLFVGLITGNLPVIFREVKKCEFRKRYLIGGVFAFAVALALGLFSATLSPAKEVAGVTSSLPIFALSGLAGGVAGPVPGMSVSMVLIVTQVYRQLIFAAESLLHMEFAYIIPLAVFGICAIVGVVLAARGINLIFDKYPGFANSLVLGFMSGSLIGILVQSLQLEDLNFNWILGAAALAAGLGISMLFVVLGKSMNKEQEE